MNSSKSALDQDGGKLLEAIEVTTADNPEYVVIRHSYPIPHSVSQPGMADIDRWLTACFKW